MTSPSILWNALTWLMLPMLFVLEGCGGPRSFQESKDLDITFVALSQDEQGYGIFSVNNTTDKKLDIKAVKVIDKTSGEEYPSSLLKLTSRKIEAHGWEYGVFQVTKTTPRNNIALYIEYEHDARRLFSRRPVKSTDIWVTNLYPSEDFSSLYFYFMMAEPVTDEKIANCVVLVNGVEASVSDFSVWPTKDEKSLVCLKITPPQKLSEGERIFVRAAWNGKTVFGACTKVFYPFVAGPTQYGKVMRPANIEFGKDSITLNIYNEADFRKCPAVIGKVHLDGKDVTSQCVFPDKPFPPDLHNYDDDVRPVVVKNISLDKEKKYRFDIDFRRLEPLRPSSVTEGYFDLQRFSFDVQQDVPYEIDIENGLKGGVCTLYAGLRPRPETAELIRRYDSVVSVDPSIPVYLCPHEGTKLETVFQLAASSDFILPGQLNPLIPATFNKAQKFFEHVRYMRKLPVPWACSVISDNDHQTFAQDLEWLVWGAVGAGSHGVFLSAHEKGDIEKIAECRNSVDTMFRQIKTLSPLLGISVQIDLKYGLNQSGIHVDVLACGTDHILAVVVNEWSTRCCFQESEPFMAAMRKDVRLSLSLGEHWKTVEVIDPIQKRSIFHDTDDQGNIKIELPCFDNVQTVLLSRGNMPFEGNAVKESDTAVPSVVFLDNPVVSLGVLRPGTERTIEIQVQSNTEKTLVLTGNAASNQDSKPGEVQTEELTLEAMGRNTIRIKYKPPMTNAKSVTNIQYTSPDLPGEEFPIYLCAEVENPAELSPSMLDFGYTQIGETCKPKTVSLKSPDTTAKITKAVSEGNLIQNIRIADDGKSFSFSVASQKTGPFSEEMTVEITMNEGQETITPTVRCSGHAQTVVYASPPQISLVMDDQAKKYTVGIRHIADKPIRISSVFAGKTIQCRFDPDKPNRNPTIELTISPEIRKLKEETVVVKGTVEGGENFSLSIPVTAFAPQTPNSSQTE